MIDFSDLIGVAGALATVPIQSAPVGSQYPGLREYMALLAWW